MCLPEVFWIWLGDVIKILKSIEDIFGTTDQATDSDVREFIVPAALKPKLRATLSKIGLDAFNIYGGPDALGLSIANKYNSFFEKHTK